MRPTLIPARNASEWTGPTGNNTWLLPGREPALIDAGAGEIVSRVYPGLSSSLRSAAIETVIAHLTKLREDGRL